MHCIKRRVGLLTIFGLILLLVIDTVMADTEEEGDGTGEDGTGADETDEDGDSDDDGPLCPKDDSPVHKPCDENGECNIDGYYCAKIPWKGEEKQYCCLENPDSGGDSGGRPNPTGKAPSPFTLPGGITLDDCINWVKNGQFCKGSFYANIKHPCKALCPKS